jgi:hypothetical protein
MTANQIDERDAILRAAEYAPVHPVGPIALGLAGWWTPAGWFVCARDVARINERGCRLPAGSDACWEDSPRGVCVVCESRETGGRGRTRP